MERDMTQSIAEMVTPVSDVLPELTDDVIERMGGAADSRFRHVLTLLVRHLHAFVREASLTQDEWQAAIAFLTRAGQICTDDRQEFILLSDILGVSMLVDAVNNVAGPGISDSTVLGPFYTGLQRELKNGDTILLRDEDREPLVMHGRVTDAGHGAIAGALVQVWQTAPNQLYDAQDADQPRGHLRASFRTDADGFYRFRTVMPVSYPIPSDGPAGRLLQYMGRHPFRPAHVHFMISAPGYRTLITHLFFAGDEYLASDAVFGVKPSLIVRPEPRGGVQTVEYDFGLARDVPHAVREAKVRPANQAVG
jgi:protocatechuate 3,4-dioxygenase beta subunit